MRPGKKEKAIIAERKLQALDLRKAGYSYRAIGKKLNVSHEQARQDIEEELRRLAEERKDEATELLQLELERLDMLIKGLEPMARIGKPDAVNSFLKCMERRAKLLGLDAPVKADVTSAGQPMKGYVGISPDDWDS